MSKVSEVPEYPMTWQGQRKGQGQGLGAKVPKVPVVLVFQGARGVKGFLGV